MTGGERGIRSLGHPLDSVSYTNHIARNAGNASVAAGLALFFPLMATVTRRSRTAPVGAISCCGCACSRPSTVTQARNEVDRLRARPPTKSSALRSGYSFSLLSRFTRMPHLAAFPRRSLGGGFSAGGGETPHSGHQKIPKTAMFIEAPRFGSLGPVLAPLTLRVSRVPNSFAFDRLFAGNWAERRPPLQDMV